MCWKEYLSDISYAHIFICLCTWWKICWNISCSTFCNLFSFYLFHQDSEHSDFFPVFADMHMHHAGFSHACNQMKMKNGIFVFGYFLFLFSQVEQNSISILDILKQSNSYLPHVLIASILLALIYPRSLTWFTSRSVDVLMNW